jgi:hypothetical protein
VVKWFFQPSHLAGQRRENYVTARAACAGAETRRVACRRKPELPSVLAAELGGAVVCDPVSHGGDVVGAGEQQPVRGRPVQRRPLTLEKVAAASPAILEVWFPAVFTVSG